MCVGLVGSNSGELLGKGCSNGSLLLNPSKSGGEEGRGVEALASAPLRLGHPMAWALDHEAALATLKMGAATLFFPSVAVCKALRWGWVGAMQWREG